VSLKVTTPRSAAPLAPVVSANPRPLHRGARLLAAAFAAGRRLGARLPLCRLFSGKLVGRGFGCRCRSSVSGCWRWRSASLECFRPPALRRRFRFRTTRSSRLRRWRSLPAILSPPPVLGRGFRVGHGALSAARSFCLGGLLAASFPAAAERGRRFAFAAARSFSVWRRLALGSTRLFRGSLSAAAFASGRSAIFLSFSAAASRAALFH